MARLPIIEVLDWYFRVKYIKKWTVSASCAFSVAHRSFGTSCCTTSSTMKTFKKRLKTHIFHCIMWNVLVTERLCISCHSAIQVLPLYCIVLYYCNIKHNANCNSNCFCFRSECFTRNISVLEIDSSAACIRQRCRQLQINFYQAIK